MKVIEIGAKNLANLIFKEKEKLPQFGFYLTKNTRDDYEGGCEIGVVKFADSYLVIGNYCGGGSPFCCDITSDDDSSALYECMKSWLEEIDCDMENREPVLHIDSAGKGSLVFPEAVIVIKDGGLSEVYSSIENIGVELIDLDVSDPDKLKDAESALADVKVQCKAGSLFSRW